MNNVVNEINNSSSVIGILIGKGLVVNIHRNALIAISFLLVAKVCAQWRIPKPPVAY